MQKTTSNTIPAGKAVIKFSTRKEPSRSRSTQSIFAGVLSSIAIKPTMPVNWTRQVCIQLADKLTMAMHQDEPSSFTVLSALQYMLESCTVLDTSSNSRGCRAALRLLLPDQNASMQATPGSSCPDPMTVVETQILCPCTPQEFPPYGACPQGLQCAAASQNPLWDPTGDPLWVQAEGFLCQPCVYGQYCPRGSFQPVSGAALLQYVDRYSCRHVSLSQQALGACAR